MPVLDLVNFNYFESGYEQSIEAIVFQNLHHLNPNNEFYQSYIQIRDPIRFFINFGFYPENYRSIIFEAGEIFIRPKNLIQINNNKHLIKDPNSNQYRNKNSICFKNLNIPKNLILILSFMKNKKFKVDFFIKVLDLYSSCINEDLVDKILFNSDENTNIIIINYCKSIKLYLENIKIIKNKIEKSISFD